MMTGWTARSEGRPARPWRRDLVEVVRAGDPLLDTATAGSQAMARWRRATGLGPLEPLLADPEIGEIMINGPGDVWVDRGPRVEQSGVTMSDDDLGLLIERVLDPLGLRVDPSSPLADARLPDGSRVNVVVPPLAVDGPVVTIRRFAERVVPLSAFGDRSLAAELGRLVEERRNLLVVGATSSGKTTLLNALGALLGGDERLVTIEDTIELRLPGRHVVRLEARRANSEGVGEVSIRDLVRNALRMRPDRLIVGEVRGAEALDLIMGLNTGHRGSLATCHADGPADAVERLVALAHLAASGLSEASLRSQIASAFDTIVCVRRVGSRRLVSEIATLGPAPGPGPDATPTPIWRRADLDPDPDPDPDVGGDGHAEGEGAGEGAVEGEGAGDPGGGAGLGTTTGARGPQWR